MFASYVRPVRIAALAMVFTAAVGASADASLVTVYYSSTVTQLENDLDNVFPTIGIGVGSVVTGSFAYDTATPAGGNTNFAAFSLVSFTTTVPGGATSPTIFFADVGATDYWIVNAGLNVPGASSSGISLGVSGDFGFTSPIAAPFPGPPILDQPTTGSRIYVYGYKGTFYTAALMTTTFP